MTKQYSPQELARFVWEVNEAQLKLYEGQAPGMKHALEITTGIHEAFRQAFIELWMLKNMTPEAWFESEDVYRKTWADMIRSARARYDAIEESVSETVVAEQMAGEENPVMSLLQNIATGIQSLNEMMAKMVKPEGEPAPEEPPAEEAPPTAPEE